jgi:flagellar hook-length control protein FliK
VDGLQRVHADQADGEPPDLIVAKRLGGEQDIGDTLGGPPNAREAAQSSAQPSAQSPWRSAEGDLRALSEQLRETLGNRIVKQSGIILRNNESGEIRLTLRPEHLGSVRIRIQLEEHHLQGRIVVDSTAVKEVFDENLEALQRAFRDSGFHSASIDVAVGGDGTHERRQASLPTERAERERFELTARAVGEFADDERAVDLVV